jgi:thioredoxin 1
MSRRGLELTDANFKQEVLDADVPVLVDFWGSWCPPCKMVEPVVDELAADFDGKLKVYKLNVDLNPRTAATFSIAGAPTFILFHQGQPVRTEVGARSKKQLLQVIEAALAPRYARPPIEISAMDAAAKAEAPAKTEKTTERSRK